MTIQEARWSLYGYYSGASSSFCLKCQVINTEHIKEQNALGRSSMPWVSFVQNGMLDDLLHEYLEIDQYFRG